MWTFQEVMMSRKCMVWCGEFYMSWHLLQNACLAMENTGFDRSAGIQQDIPYVESQNRAFMGWKHFFVTVTA